MKSVSDCFIWIKQRKSEPDLGLVWRLKPQMSRAAVAGVDEGTPAWSLQDGPAVAVKAETAALETGCCSAAAVIWGRKCEDNEDAAIKTSNTENQRDRHSDVGKHTHHVQASPMHKKAEIRNSNGVWLHWGQGGETNRGESCIKIKSKGKQRDRKREETHC